MTAYYADFSDTFKRRRNIIKPTTDNASIIENAMINDSFWKLHMSSKCSSSQNVLTQILLVQRDSVHSEELRKTLEVKDTEQDGFPRQGAIKEANAGEEVGELQAQLISEELRNKQELELLIDDFTKKISKIIINKMVQRI